MAGPRAAISGLRLSGGLPALQDRLNQIRAQKGEANQASDVAPSDAVRLAESCGDRTRPVASSSTHARPRAITLISAGSHREGWFCCASPGSTSLVSTPRRLNATAAEAQ